MEKKDANFFTAQIRLWTRIIDYKGTSTVKEYWFAFIFHVLIGILAFINIAISFLTLLLIDDWNIGDIARVAHYVFIVLAVIKLVYLAFSLIPWIALTVRRLRDAGKSAWWTLLLLLLGVGQIILLFICTIGSSFAGVFNPAVNHPEAIYGPPEMLDPSYNQNGDVYGPPMWDPDENVPDTDYGPIWNYDEDEDFEFNSDDNVPATLYGPPDMFEEDDYIFDPDANQNMDVYGPPDWLDE